MHRHARPGALLIVFVLALLAGAVHVHTSGQTGAAAPTVGVANVTPHPDDDQMAHAATPATQHLSAPTLFGLPTEAAQPPSVGPVGDGTRSLPRRAAVQDSGTRQDRAPPAVSAR